MKCHNPNRPSICLCPANDRGVGVRTVLNQPFINGWLSDGLVRAANAMALDASVSEERCWRMLFALEDNATDAYEMWRSCQ